MNGKTCTIVPPDASPGGITRTSGTKVLLDDGTELGNVSRIILTAVPGDVWRAEIHCSPRMGVMKGMEAVITTGRGSWWRRALCRLAGVELARADIAAFVRDWRKP